MKLLFFLNNIEMKAVSHGEIQVVLMRFVVVFFVLCCWWFVVCCWQLVLCYLLF